MLSWTLWLTATLAVPLAPCGADAFEPNNLRRKARRLASDATQRKLLGPVVGATAGVPAFNGATCVDDVDWYRVHFDRGAQVTLTISHHPTARLETPRVFKPGGRKFIGKVERERGEVRVKFRARRAGDYRLRIAGRDKTRTAYSVMVSAR